MNRDDYDEMVSIAANLASENGENPEYDRALAEFGERAEWSGSPDPEDPDNYWIDDETGERVNAHTGERTGI